MPDRSEPLTEKSRRLRRALDELDRQADRLAAKIRQARPALPPPAEPGEGPPGAGPADPAAP